ncbi:MAG: hypothetical protein LAT50_08545 [Ectothiorhodospiraceae bacterium]|nr:hypothetical protein [Ectothiorhodospiraceae bacterium]
MAQTNTQNTSVLPGAAAGTIADLPLEHLPRRGTDRRRFDDRPTAVELWLRQLPLANIMASGQRIRNTLEELTGIGYAPALRIRILQQIEPTVGYIMDGLRRHYLHTNPPFPTRSRQAALLAIHLREELARGYRLALLSGEEWGNLRRRHRTDALLGVVRHTAAALLECWNTYREPPPGAWALLHGTRRQAVASGLYLRRTPHPGGRSRLEDVYLQTLLTAAAGPYRMNRGEAMESFRLLAGFAPHAGLVNAGHQAAAGSHFQVDPDEDEGPSPCLKAPDNQPARMLYIHTEELVTGLEQRLDQQGLLWWRRRLTPRDASLMRQLVIGLGAISKRRFPRKQDQSHAALVVGLSHIHRILGDGDGGQLAVSEFMARDPRRSGMEVGDQDIWNLIYPRELLNMLDENNGEDRHAERDIEQLQPDQAETYWQLVNASAGGYCLLAEKHAQLSRAQVGDIVLVSPLGTGCSGPWQTGVIRWLCQQPATGTRLGIQLIAPCPLPVYTRTVLPDGRLSDPSRSLLVPAVRPDHEPVTLVTPALHYQQGQRVFLKGQGHTGEFRLERRLEKTALFGQFEFRPPSHGEEAQGSPDHDTLWADL